jgi:hypothetical protein
MSMEAPLKPLCKKQKIENSSQAFIQKQKQKTNLTLKQKNQTLYN